MSEWKIQGSRVYGNGQSYNCTNIATAKQLQCTLNNYELTTNTLNPDKQLEQIHQKLEHIEFTLNEIKEALK